MGRQIVHRLLVWFPALLGVLFLCFCLLQVVPADPAMIIAGPEARAETIAAIYDRPPHPCTQALLSAIPRPDPRVRKKRMLLAGDVPSPFARRPAAASTRAAPSLRTAAARRSRCCATPAAAIASPATSTNDPGTDDRRRRGAGGREVRRTAGRV